MTPKQRVLGKKKATRDESMKQAPNLVLALPSSVEVQSNVPSPQQVNKRKGKQHDEGFSHQKKGMGVGSLFGTPNL